MEGDDPALHTQHIPHRNCHVVEWEAGVVIVNYSIRVQKKQSVDSWMLYNNTESGFELVAIGEGNKFDITNETLFSNFKENIK